MKTIYSEQVHLLPGPHNPLNITSIHEYMMQNRCVFGTSHKRAQPIECMYSLHVEKACSIWFSGSSSVKLLLVKFEWLRVGGGHNACASANANKTAYIWLFIYTKHALLVVMPSFFFICLHTLLPSFPSIYLYLSFYFFLFLLPGPCTSTTSFSYCFFFIFCAGMVVCAMNHRLFYAFVVKDY